MRNELFSLKNHASTIFPVLASFLRSLPFTAVISLLFQLLLDEREFAILILKHCHTSLQFQIGLKNSMVALHLDSPKASFPSFIQKM